MKKVIKRIILIVVIAFAALLAYGAYLDATGYDPDEESASSIASPASSIASSTSSASSMAPQAASIASSDTSSGWTLIDVPEAAKKQVAAYVMDQMAERSDAKLAYPPSGDWTVYQYVGGQIDGYYTVVVEAKQTSDQHANTVSAFVSRDGSGWHLHYLDCWSGVLYDDGTVPD